MDYIRNKDQLIKFLQKEDVSIFKINQIIQGISKNSMALRISDHILSLINWNNVDNDPLRKQFLPYDLDFKPDHKYSSYDSLAENNHTINSRIVRRYPNKILFFASKTCETYCAFCTRSYMIGPSTDSNNKNISLLSIKSEINFLRRYLEANTEIQDITISGGDINTLHHNILSLLLETLANINSIRSVRLATRGFSFSPKKLDDTSNHFDVIKKFSEIMRCNHKRLSIQTHFNHANEISHLTTSILRKYFINNIEIRNQTVLLKSINDNYESMSTLISKLIDSGVTPYYVYQMDMIKNAEHYRTKIENSILLEKSLSGVFPGFYIPKFVVDLPGGGGKKLISHYENKNSIGNYYVYKSNIKNNQLFRYYDPLF